MESREQLAVTLTHTTKGQGHLGEEYGDDEDMSELGQDNNHATSDAETSVSTDTSANATPLGSGTPTGSVVVPGRDRSGTVVARPIWDTQPPPQPESFRLSRRRTLRARARQPQQVATTSSSSTSRPETETEDDGDQDVDGDIEMSQDQARRAVGIVSDSPPPNGGAGGPSDSLEVDLDAHIIINTTNNEEGTGGVENGIVALDRNVNDDLAMGAPPGAPGAIDGTPRTRTNALAPFTLPRDGTGTGREELTPRAVLAALPMHTPMPVAMPMQTGVGLAQQGVRDTTGLPPSGWTSRSAWRCTNPNGHAEAGMRHCHHHHRHAQGHHHAHIEQDTGPFREEDVLLSLQLLAYLSKYPHVRQAFYKPRTSFHPATAQLPRSQPFGTAVPRVALASATATAATGGAGGDPSKKDPGFFKPFTVRGKEQGSKTVTSGAASAGTAQATNVPPQRMTNVFSLVERFTFRPSPTESMLPQPPPFLPPEIQYWAGVIMRNACRKDESRGGIRQCANMLCGKWDSFCNWGD
ncbi:hypothetical protein BD410DRAFT_844448 [Rickenella mellea]|uniref:Uncharacterized protein n=1 Tax=Rickenella mellea TaxID=50990 RepID=A0A4Y7PNJ0_9AGAM|nr:hypothetical protein BD410DRAFT_844448 [Rickenella mellea]